MRLIPSFEKSTNKVKDWSMVSFKENVLVINVQFENVMAVSINVIILILFIFPF